MKKQKTILITITGLILFGWFAIRPAKIKHDCSWVERHEDGVPERPAVTKDELVSRGIIRSCDNEIAELKKVMPSADYKLGDNNVSYKSMSSIDGEFRSMTDDPLWQATSCIVDGNKIIEEYKNAIPAKPARDWYVASTDSQYKFCLRDKGL